METSVEFSEEQKLKNQQDTDKAVEEHQRIQLPPLPEPLFELTEEEQKVISYGGDPTDMTLRMRFKLLNIWSAWGSLRTNERLVKIVNQKDYEDSMDDVQFLKTIIVSTVHRLGAILAATDTAQELFPRNLSNTEYQPKDELTEEEEKKEE